MWIRPVIFQARRAGCQEVREAKKGIQATLRRMDKCGAVPHKRYQAYIAHLCYCPPCREELKVDDWKFIPRLCEHRTGFDFGKVCLHLVRLVES